MSKVSHDLRTPLNCIITLLNENKKDIQKHILVNNIVPAL